MQKAMDVQRDVNHYERLKVLFLSGVFFSIIASYTIIKELKDSLFIDIVGGKEYVPFAKLFMIIGLIPIVLFYSKMVDTVRRYQLLCFFAYVYSIVGFLCAGVVAYYGVGVENTSHSFVYWLFGWLYFFYVESFSPFILGVFWAFLSSITSPDGAKKNYGTLISWSKIGGMMTSGLAWFLLAHNNGQYGLGMSETTMHFLLMILSATLLLAIPLIITVMMKKVPGRYLHGYEAAYQFEKHQSKLGEDAEAGMWTGLKFLIKNPYVFGIFASVFFYEVVNAVLSYMRLGIAQDSSGGTVSGASCFLFKIVFITHFVGFIISWFGTRRIVTFLGERLSLMVMPLVIGLLLLYLVFSSSPNALIAAFVVLRAVYYAFSQPVTESLYIPTVKTMKFKSKAWIDTFGKKFARGFGSTFNIMIAHLAGAGLVVFQGIFFSSIIGIWVVVSYFLGKRYQRAVRRGEVIGSRDVEKAAHIAKS
jgi:AAA family ATP:ADP antiporter